MTKNCATGYEIVNILCSNLDYICVPREILCESICTGVNQCVGQTDEEPCKTTESRKKKEAGNIHRRPVKITAANNIRFKIGLFS